MSVLGTIGIGVVIAAVSYAAYQDQMRRRDIDASTPSDVDKPLISEGWQYVIKQTGIRVLIGFGVIALLAVLFIITHAGFWEALTSNEAADGSRSAQSTSDVGANDEETAFRLSFRRSYVSSCTSATIEGVRKRNPTEKQMERASVMAQSLCACMADQFNETFSVSELVQYNLNPQNSPLAPRANQIMQECTRQRVQ